MEITAVQVVQITNFWDTHEVQDLVYIGLAGKYCVGGRIAGDCAAGYYCVVGMDLPNPNNSYAPNGQLCPYGYYCPAGNYYLFS